MNRIEENDVPDHQPGLESSIGAFGAPRADSFNRLKGFYEHIVNTPERAGELMRQFYSGLARLTDGGEYTRLQHRAVFEEEMLCHIGSAIERYVEAIVPLDAGHLGKAPLLVYLAAITPSRSQHVDDIANLLLNLTIAQGVSNRSTAEILGRAHDRGYDVRILSTEERQQESVQNQIAELYARFGWSRPDVVRMLVNPSNILSVARHNGQIVSSGLAEMAMVPIVGHPFRITELTEAATLAEHEGNGCFAAISRMLLLELRQRSQARGIFGGELDVAFGESNGLSEGILRIAAGQGRTFSTHTTPEFGFTKGGVLRQQVPISGPMRRTEYNDLIVTSLTRSQVYAIG